MTRQDIMKLLKDNNIAFVTEGELINLIDVPKNETCMLFISEDTLYINCPKVKSKEIDLKETLSIQQLLGEVIECIKTKHKDLEYYDLDCYWQVVFDKINSVPEISKLAKKLLNNNVPFRMDKEGIQLLDLPHFLKQIYVTDHPDTGKVVIKHKSTIKEFETREQYVIYKPNINDILKQIICFIENEQLNLDYKDFCPAWQKLFNKNDLTKTEQHLIKL